MEQWPCRTRQLNRRLTLEEADADREEDKGEQGPKQKPKPQAVGEQRRQPGRYHGGVLDCHVRHIIAEHHRAGRAIRRCRERNPDGELDAIFVHKID